MRHLLVAVAMCMAVNAWAEDKASPQGGTQEQLDVSKLPFTAASIQKVVMHHQPQVQSCYEETLAEKEKVVEGKLLTSFVITPEGLVKKAKVDRKGSTLKEPRLHDCVVAVLSTITFPKPPDGRDHPVEYPFNLKAIK